VITIIHHKGNEIQVGRCVIGGWYLKVNGCPIEVIHATPEAAQQQGIAIVDVVLEKASAWAVEKSETME
jgi:hypothetical protein